MINIKRYAEEDEKLWNSFIYKAKNSTFLFHRNFMDYHKDRFEDYSLLIFIKDKIIGVLPASINGKGTLISHAGLTYGGLLVNKDIRLNDYLKIFKSLLKYLNRLGIYQLVLKTIPDFYSTVPSQEHQYALFLVNAKRVRVDTAIAIDKRFPLKYQNRRRRSVQKGKKNNCLVVIDNNFEKFWREILEPNLMERFGKKPVHSLEEILLLQQNFPENIYQVNVYIDKNIVAGGTMFVNNNVVHAQYISGNDFGRKSGALDLLFDEMISVLYKDYDYFDFGICNENKGKELNHGLLDWKEGFGGRTFVHEFFKIETKNHLLIDVVI